MSGIKKRSVSLHGHRTSFSIEDEFMAILENMASAQSVSVAKVIADVDESRGQSNNLSSALRLAALSYARTAAI